MNINALGLLKKGGGIEILPFFIVILTSFHLVAAQPTTPDDSPTDPIERMESIVESISGGKNKRESPPQLPYGTDSGYVDDEEFRDLYQTLGETDIPEKSDIMCILTIALGIEPFIEHFYKNDFNAFREALCRYDYKNFVASRRSKGFAKRRLIECLKKDLDFFRRQIGRRCDEVVPAGQEERFFQAVTLYQEELDELAGESAVE